MHLRNAIFLPFVLGSLAACQPPPPPAPPVPPPTAAVVTGTEHAVATIKSVNRRTREVVLAGSDGRRFVVKLGPDVRNFDQLRAGQRVDVTYEQAFAAEIAPAGSSGSPRAALGAGRAAPGQLPAGAVAGAVRVRVTITGLDLPSNTVSFVGPRGITRVVVVKDPGMQAMLGSLHVGSKVDLTYVEALSVRVEPVAN